MKNVMLKWAFEDTKDLMIPAEVDGRYVAMDSDAMLPIVWGEVDGDDLAGINSTFVVTTFTFVGTGHPLPDGDHSWHYVGSCGESGRLVWHVYSHQEQRRR